MPAHVGWLKDHQKKDKNRVTILFIDWLQEEPENKKRFEDIARKKERN